MTPIFDRLRLLAIFAVVGLTATTLATYGWAGAKTVKLIATLLDGGWRNEVNLAELLSVVDVYLLAIVQMIMVIGLYELFIGDLEVPDWLEIHSLDDLKKSLVDVLVVFVAVTGVKDLLSARDPDDALTSAIAVSVIIVALTLFRFATAKGKVAKPPAD